MARSSKNPRGGGGLLFLAGLGLEVVVAIVAFRTVLADELASSDLADLLPGRKEEAVSAPATVVPATPADPPAEPGTLADVQTDVVARLGPSAAICAGIADAADAGAMLRVELDVAADGTVAAALVTGVSGPLAACMEAEASQWQLTPPGRSVRITRSVRFE